MRLVLETNTVISGGVARAYPARYRERPRDDHVVACAVAARADLIVSGDKHLLDLRNYGDIEIVNAAQAIAHIESATI